MKCDVNQGVIHTLESRHKEAGHSLNNAAYHSRPTNIEVIIDAYVSRLGMMYLAKFCWILRTQFIVEANKPGSSKKYKGEGGKTAKAKHKKKSKRKIPRHEDLANIAFASLNFRLGS